jgi:hypothetical protein
VWVSAGDVKKAGFKKESGIGQLVRGVGQQLSIDRVFDHLQATTIYIDQFGLSAGLIQGSLLLISLVSASGSYLRKKRTHIMKNRTSMRIRVARFLSERYEQRERPGYFADLLVWTVIVLVAAYPMLPLARAMEMLK